MLYTSPSGAVQIVFVWISLAFVYLWPNRRCAIVIGFTIVPLTGIILLFVLPLSAGWGMIIASWLVRPITHLTAPPKPVHSVDNLCPLPGFHHFKYLLDPTKPERIQYAREHEEGDRECSILCWLRRRLYLRPTALGHQARAAVSQRAGPGSC